MQETDLIGAPFSKQRLSMTLYDAAKSNEHGVFYEAADPEINLVRPCVMPSALSMRSAYDGDTAVAQSVVKLWEKVHCSLTSGKRNAMEGWEMVVPLLEVIASTLMYEVDKERPVKFCDVWRGAHVQHWAGCEASLLYRPVGKDCVNVWRAGAKEPATEAADDEALRASIKYDTPTLCKAETPTYPSIDGVHTLLERVLPSGTRGVTPVMIQMKADKTVQRHHLVEWAEKAHARAKHLGLKNESYYVGLYVSNKGCGKLEIVHP
ncbi:Hypothetical protein, putative [Bodo saltans]|uniref:Uncharacterized protein n=1 Tax=Bodo saltans TaxID=75058 RepID=A0A0S4JGB0_BODSA|nr:Hypothetical protein, putative [Bodo saltans]|eukprot:CUG90522.1 Hypothetical protein, putative [Bodo saltans]